MTAFDSMFESAFTLFDETFSSTVTYSRGGVSIGSLTALESKISNDEQVEFGANLIKEGKVFQILKTELVISAVEVEPASLDIITESNGNVWEVANFANLPNYETDVNELYWRIRTIKTNLGS